MRSHPHQSDYTMPKEFLDTPKTVEALLINNVDYREIEASFMERYQLYLRGVISGKTAELVGNGGRFCLFRRMRTRGSNPTPR